MVSKAKSIEPIDERTRIIRKAQDLFFANGFTRVTTDEVARELGISKKTLYQHFGSKDDLVAAAVLLMREEIAADIHAVVSDSKRDFVEKLHDLLVAVGSRMSRIQRTFLEELPRKAPHVWADLEAFRREVLFRELSRLIAQGSRRGMIRRDVDPQLFLQMFFVTISGILHPEALSNMPFAAADVFRSILTVYMQGVLTDDARARFIRENQS
jgi:AcrR family transcriptional regulator